MRSSTGNVQQGDVLIAVLSGEHLYGVHKLKLTGSPSPSPFSERSFIMEDKDIRISQTATRMRDFGVAQSGNFSAESLGGQKFAELNALITAIDEHGAQQTLSKASAQGSTEANRSLRIYIRSKMKSVRNTAVSLEPEIPGISNSFRMPVGNSDEVLINSARAFVQAATPLKSHFISREMPENFLEDLTAAIEQLEASVSNHNKHRANRVAATASLKATLSRVLEIRRELDPIVRNKFRNDPATLAAWESASHLERAPKKSVPAQAPASQP